MTLSLANSVEDVEPGCSGCNTQSDSDSESLNSFRFTDIKGVKLMTGVPAAASSIVFKDSPNATVGDTFNIHIGKANINGKDFDLTNHNIQIPCENNDSEPRTLPLPMPQAEVPTTPKKSNKTLIILLSCLAFVVALAGLAIWLLSSKTANSKEITTITTEHPETTTKSDDYGAIVPREGWGAEPPKSPLQAMDKSATLVVMKHTGGATCSNFLECTQRVKDIQLEHFNVKNYRDISYNFLLGGDGRVYYGRGWRVMNEGRNESVDFAFIGNFNDLKPSDNILNVAKWLITVGEWNKPSGIDSSKYVVISHNLTEPTNSPGAHLYARMDSFLYNIFQMCYANCSDGSYVEAETCPPKEKISC